MKRKTQATAEFLAFSKLVGNDLSTPIPMYLFPGLCFFNFLFIVRVFFSGNDCAAHVSFP